MPDMKYLVHQGDCISSLAFKFGVSIDKMWNHSANARLRQERQDLNVLKPGDIIFIPARELKEENGATEQRHRFRRKEVPAKLCLRLLDWEDRPRGNLRYVLMIDGISRSGMTNPNGEIDEWISPNARRAILHIEEQDGTEEYELSLGHLDPVSEASGVIQRLTNLGYHCGGATALGEQTYAALRAFQNKYNLSPTGQADAETRQKLQEIHEA